jgi:ABC-type multidrug transport system fused ATPase/permease subunit
VAPKFLSKYLEERVAVTAYSEYIWILNVKYVSLRNLFIFITQVLVLFLTARLYLAGQLSVGVIYIFFALTSRIFGLIASITRILRQIPIRFVELEKYLEIIDKTPEFKEGGEDSFSEGDVIFSDVSFRYPKGDEDVLKNISISIPKGKKVAFVGHSGSGKTTLTKLLLRSYNYTSGSILLGGKELKDIDADSLRENIGYVEQHVDLFDDTVKNNILLSVKAETLLEWEEKVLTEGKLEDVAKLARIDEFYHRLGEKKFDTEIGERGIKLSGGERQRIGIARAIIKEPAILIFDEATSALDAVNERYIKEAIDNVSEGRTTLIIAHRLSTVVGCDCIYVLDRGRVVASGTHTELLKKSPEYQDLIKNQNLLA